MDRVINTLRNYVRLTGADGMNARLLHKTCGLEPIVAATKAGLIIRTGSGRFDQYRLTHKGECFITGTTELPK